MRKWGRIGGLALLVGTLLSPLQFNAVYAAGVDRENISYISMNNPDNYQLYIDYMSGDGKKSSLDVVSPNYFKIDKDGKLNNVAIREDFIQQMHQPERNIRVVPFLQSEDYITLDNREELVNQLANDIDRFHLDGINIDLEKIDSKYRENFTNFVKEIRNAIPREKQVSVAVAAVPTGIPTGWQKTYDYKKIAEALDGPNDYIVIMTYDEFGNTKQGTVARLSFVENSIKYALSQVPKKKILLGIPLYGKLWRSTDQAIITIPHWKIFGDPSDQGILKTFNLKPTFNNTTQTPEATFTLSKDTAYKIDSKNTFTAGEYKIWFDDEQSIKKKLSLVRKYDLRGAASWSFIQEQTSMWDYYNNWLKAEKFSDISETIESWDYWAKDSIYAVNVKGWMQGEENGYFKPKDYLTRAEAATIMVRAMGLEKKSPTKPIAFSDVNGHWALNNIRIAYENQLVSGYPDGTFKPEAPITRQEIAKMLDNLLKLQDVSKPKTSPFTDVSNDENNPNYWSYQAILNLSQNGIINGYKQQNGTYQFKPTKNITREEMAQVMGKTLNEGLIK